MAVEDEPAVGGGGVGGGGVGAVWGVLVGVGVEVGVGDKRG